ncbi:MAG TPA: hypothetical protein VMG38_20375 [Trebonia sp.]|nr:hypothetical protein [Trebonia sp.]
MESTTFTALAERAGRWWTVRVPQIEGLAVQVRSLDQAEMMARRHICEALHLPPEAVRVDLRTETSMLPAVAQALQARQAAVRAAEAAARATLTALEALVADGATFQEAAIVLALSPDEITEFTTRLQARGSRPRTAPVAPGGAGAPPGPAAPAAPGAAGNPAAPGGPGAPGGPRSRGDAGTGNGPPTGPTGLPQRMRSSGSQPVHP